MSIFAFGLGGGGIFAQSLMDFNAINMYSRAPEDLENVQDIS